MQGVDAGVAPVAVEVVLGQGGLAAGQLEQGGASGERDLGADRPRLGHGDGGGGQGLGVAVGLGEVEDFPGALEQGFGGVQADRQVAEAFRVSGSSLALSRPESIHGRLRVRTKCRASSKAARAMPVSMAAWRICASGPTVVGRSKAL